MHQDVGGDKEAVWKPPAEKHIYISTTSTGAAACLGAVTLCWIQSSSHVKQPHLRRAFARRHLQRAVTASLHNHVTEFHLEHSAEVTGDVGLVDYRGDNTLRERTQL